ncbi:MAG: ABC transporter permease [Ignisphaera sp.]
MSLKLAKYLAVRGVSVAVSLLIAILLVALVSNLGGRLDEFLFNEIKTSINNQFIDENFRKQVDSYCEVWCKLILGENTTDVDLRNCLTRCRDEYVVNETLRIMREQYGIDIDQPVLLRIFGHWVRAISLNLGQARFLHSYHTRQRDVKTIIAEALPQTVLLFTTANIIIFAINLALGLSLSRRYGKTIDKLAVSLAPLSSMPGWFYGLILLVVFGIWLRILPDGGMMSTHPPENVLLRGLDVIYHMILPILSWMVAYIPIGTYSYRTFFLIFSTEEYVEYARVRGVPERMIQRRYILRPTLPPIITSFVLMLIGSWMGAIITERIFRWPGLGTVLYNAIGGGANIDVPVVVGIMTIYAYLLAISVLLLDIIYAVIDPRVRVGGE